MMKVKILKLMSDLALLICKEKSFGNKRKTNQQIIEIRADSVGKSQDGKDWSLKISKI